MERGKSAGKIKRPISGEIQIVNQTHPRASSSAVNIHMSFDTSHDLADRRKRIQI